MDNYEIRMLKKRISLLESVVKESNNEIKTLQKENKLLMEALHSSMNSDYNDYNIDGISEEYSKAAFEEYGDFKNN